MNPTPYETVAAAVCQMAADVLSVQVEDYADNWKATVSYNAGKRGDSEAYGHGDSPFAAVQSARKHARHFEWYRSECDRTEAILAGMLTENTGRSILDSGDAYGRHWQRNQCRDFDAEPLGTAQFWNCDGRVDMCASLNVYHWLSERLLHDEEMQARFDEFAESEPDTPWLAVMREFAESIGATGLYGDGEPFIVNTYNHDSALSQVLQYLYFETEDGENGYILLQIHGGCDVRGGYTAPKVFYSNGMHGDMDCILNDQDMTLQPEDDDSGVMWDSDDAATFHFNDWKADDIDGRDFEEYAATSDPAERGKGKVYIDEAGNGYCPITGKRLVVS